MTFIAINSAVEGSLRLDWGYICKCVQFRAASELSVAGSEAGGRFSDDEAARSSIGDGHFSCSSVFSEFGYVAQHLEEQNPGVALARCLLTLSSFPGQPYMI